MRMGPRRALFSGCPYLIRKLSKSSYTGSNITEAFLYFFEIIIRFILSETVTHLKMWLIFQKQIFITRLSNRFID